MHAFKFSARRHRPNVAIGGGQMLMGDERTQEGVGDGGLIRALGSLHAGLSTLSSNV